MGEEEEEEEEEEEKEKWSFDMIFNDDRNTQIAVQKVCPALKT